MLLLTAAFEDGAFFGVTDFFGVTSFFAVLRGGSSESVEGLAGCEAALAIALWEPVVGVVFFAAMTLDFEDAGGQKRSAVSGEM